jgi:hypothetical protein
MQRKAFLVFISLIGHQASAQSLSGTYESRQAKGTISFEYEQLCFTGSRFSYLMDSCTGTATGYGTFRLVGDSLTLHFEDSTTVVARATSAPCLVPGYCCTVFDAATRQPIAGATVILRRQWPGKRLGAITDNEGRVAFSDGVRLASPQSDSCLIISAIGYRPATIALSVGAAQGFIAHLTPSVSIAANTIYRYRLSSGLANQLLLNNRSYQQLTKRRKHQLARGKAREVKQMQKMLDARGL